MKRGGAPSGHARRGWGSTGPGQGRHPGAPDGGLVLLGLFTRPVAFLLSGEMAIAYFMAHAPNGFWPLLNHGEAAVFYCFAFLYFAAAGGGSWALENFISFKRR